MSEKDQPLQTKVTKQIFEIIQKIAREQGITESEYLRNLIISDIDRRNIFTTAIRDDVKNDEKLEREKQ